jgi:hypothetical protein
MDENKRKVLQRLGYVIRPSCGLCQKSDIGPGSDWGTCKLHTYSHLKHSESNRQLSVNRYGSCPEFEINFAVDLGGFGEFFRG